MSEDVESAVRELLELLVERLDLEAEVDIRREDDTVTGALVGDDLGLFIGRHGQTIEAVQHLAQRIAFRGQPSDVRVVIDAAGYRDRRASPPRRAAGAAPPAPPPRAPPPGGGGGGGGPPPPGGCSGGDRSRSTR